MLLQQSNYLKNPPESPENWGERAQPLINFTKPLHNPRTLKTFFPCNLIKKENEQKRETKVAPNYPKKEKKRKIASLVTSGNTKVYRKEKGDKQEKGRLRGRNLI